MARKTFRLELLLLIALVPCCAIELAQFGSATTYYVATDGNDSYNGLHPAHSGGSFGPFRTLRRASRLVKAGDTVKIRGGTYQEASSWDANGTATNPITIMNYRSEAVIIDGKYHAIPQGENGALIKIAGHWNRVRNLEIRYSSCYGLTVYGNHCLIDNIYCHHSWAAGITCVGSYALVQHCRAWYNSAKFEYGAGDNWSTGISIFGSYPHLAEHSVVRNCTAWDNWGHGIKIGLSNYAVCEDNIAYNNMFNFYVRDSRHCTFQRNISYCSPDSDMVKYVRVINLRIGDEGPTYRSSDNTFVNNLVMGGEGYNISIGGETFENGLCAYNTFVNCRGTSGNYNVRIGDGTYNNATFQNNIVLQDIAGPAIAVCVAKGVSFGYNNWSRTPPSNCRGPQDVIGDPKLAKIGPTGPGTLTPQWFKILIGSPARNRAKVLTKVKRDFFKTLRGTDPDIGAHEYQ